MQPETHARRRRRLAARLKYGTAIIINRQLPDHHADIFRPDPDLFYLSGLTEHHTALALTVERGRIVAETGYCPRRDRDFERWHGELLGPVRTRRQLGLETVRPWPGVAGIVTEQLHPGMLAWTKSSLPRLAVLCKHRTEGDEIRELDQELARLRMIKDRAEMQAIARACALTARAQLRVLRSLPGAATEAELQAELDHAYARAGAQHAFRPIVAAGRNACIAHYGANRAPLRRGQLVLVDTGCELERYVADITRTYPVSGRFTPAQRDLYETVLAAQQAAIRRARPGVSMQSLQRAASRELAYGLKSMGICRGKLETVLASEAFNRFYFHSIGHSIGLDAHDPTPGARGELKLSSGMAITIEPGLYLDASKGVPSELRHTGVRIEDVVAIKPSGRKVLTAAAVSSVAAIEERAGA